MDVIVGMDGITSSGDTYNLALGRIEGHSPVPLSFLKIVKVILEGFGVFYRPYLPIQKTIICKKPAGGYNFTR